MCTCNHGYYEHATPAILTEPREQCSKCPCPWFSSPGVLDREKYTGLTAAELEKIL